MDGLLSGSLLLSIRLIPACQETHPNIQAPAPKSSFYVWGRGEGLMLGEGIYLTLY